MSDILHIFCLQKYEYARSANPSRDVLEKCLASLDNGNYGLCFSSGLGALTAVVSLFKSGDHIVCIDDVYGGTNRYLQKVASKFNVITSLFDFEDLTLLPNVIKPATKVNVYFILYFIITIFCIIQVCRVTHRTCNEKFKNLIFFSSTCCTVRLKGSKKCEVIMLSNSEIYGAT